MKVTLLLFLISHSLSENQTKPKFISKLISKTFAQHRGNVVFSPLSVVTNLGILFQATSGQTHQILANTLGFAEATSFSKLLQKILISLNNTECIEISNRIYVSKKYKLDETYSSIVKKYFKTDVETANFLQDVINKTDNCIKSTIEEKIQSTTIENYFNHILLINGIYFKSEWWFKFSETETIKNGLFFLNQSQSKQTDMMQMLANVGYGESSSLDAKLLELPYKNEKVGMILLLPNKIDGIIELQQKLLSFDIDVDVLSNITVSSVLIKLPRFTITSHVDLKRSLIEVGLEDLFTTDADFSVLLENKTASNGLYVGQISQKINIKINEEGSETVTTTVATGRTRQAETNYQYMYSFVVDRPFLFFIIYRQKFGTGILFSGRVVTP